MYFSHKINPETISFNDYVKSYMEAFPECKDPLNSNTLYSFSIFLLNMSQSLLNCYDPEHSKFNQDSEDFKILVAALPKILFFYSLLNNSDLTNIDFDKVLNKTFASLPSANNPAESFQNYYDQDPRHLLNFFEQPLYSYHSFRTTWQNNLFESIESYQKDPSSTSSSSS